MVFVDRVYDCWIEEQELRSDAQYLANYFNALQKKHSGTEDEIAEIEPQRREIALTIAAKYSLDCARLYADLTARLLVVEPTLFGSIEAQKLRLAHFAGESGLSHFESLIFLKMADDSLNEDDCYGLRRMECFSEWVH